MRRKEKHPAKQYAGAKPWGSSAGSPWLTRDELNHIKWFEEVRCSRIKQKARGEKLKSINL